MQAIAKKLGIAKAALQSGDASRARTIAKSVLKELEKIPANEASADIIFLAEAEANLLLGHEQQAEMALQKSVNANEKEIVSAKRLAEILVNKPERGEDLFAVLAIGEQRDPKNSFWHKLRGLYYLNVGKNEEAVLHFSDAVLLSPKDHTLLDTLGVALQHIGKFEEAIVYHAEAMKLNPNEANYVRNLGVAMNKNNMTEAAIDLFQVAIEMDPKSPEVYLNLGYALDQVKRREEAEKIYLEGIKRVPKYSPLYVNLANHYHEEGKPDKAIEFYEKALKVDPNNETASFMLKTISGDTIETAPESYVKGLFDYFSKNFEDKLVGDLLYRAPGVMHNMLAESKTLKWDDGSVKMLDLGCGTGLFGLVMRKYVGTMVGLDLSQGMLDKAHEKNIYDKLECDELARYLENLNGDEYDLMAAADVFVYIGDLDRIFELVAQKLKKPGLFTFSVERTDEPNTDYTLQTTARYAHSADYLRKLIEKHGFIIEKFELEDVRRNLGQAIPGVMCVLRKE
jgi:predicted TPR repeat methyltransferase